MPSQLENITRKRRREMQRTESQAAGDILRVYESVITGIRSDLDAVLQLIDEAQANGETVNPDWLRRQSRYQRLLSQATRQFERFSGQALTHLDSARYRAVSGGAMMAYETLGALDIATDVSPFSGTINRPALERFVSATGPGPLRDVLDRFGTENADLIQDTIARGIAQGKGAKAIRREIMRGLSGDYPKHRIQTIVRTEMQRAFNASLAEQYKQVGHLISGYRWVAAKSNRTCLACLGQDGRIFKRFPLRQHVNCRCTASPVAPDSEVPYETGEAWLRRQPSHIQRRMFPTPDAWLAFRDGKVRLSDFVGTKSNKTWGDSIYQRSWSSIAKKRGLPYRTDRGRMLAELDSLDSRDLTLAQRQRALQAIYAKYPNASSVGEGIAFQNLGDLGRRIRGREKPGVYPPDGLAMSEVRAAIRGKPQEHLYAWDKDGNQLFHAIGDENSVIVPGNFVGTLRGGTIIHNHPNYGRGASNRAGSFSGADLKIMIDLDLREIQAITDRFIYVASRPANGFMIDGDAISKHYQNIRTRIERAIPDPPLGPMSDEIVEALANRGYFDYRIEDIP